MGWKMSLPKTMSESLINKLNKVCYSFGKLCDESCDNIGWCEACWIAVGGEQDPSDKYKTKPALQCFSEQDGSCSDASLVE